MWKKKKKKKKKKKEDSAGLQLEVSQSLALAQSCRGIVVDKTVTQNN
jgi:hypothetical protein